MEFAEKKALVAATGGTVTTVTTVYMALLTAAPAAGSDLTMAAEAEYSVTPPLWGYARQVLTIGTPCWSTPTSASPSVISNAGVISWGPLTSGATGAMTWGELTDAATGSGANLWVSYLLTTPRAPLVGDTVQAAIGAFTAQV